MKNNNQAHQPKDQKPTNSRSAEGVVQKRTYKPRTPITKTYLKILNDPFVFTV